MSKITLDEDRLNMEIRKFLKTVGVTSQREIEKAIRAAAEQGTLQNGGSLRRLLSKYRRWDYLM